MATLQPFTPQPNGPAPAVQPADQPAPQQPNDELLIRRAYGQSTDQGCDLLFRRYYGPLCSHAARFVYDKAVAEDIVSDIFQTFWQKRLHERITYSFRAYLYQAVRQNCLLHLQREAGLTVSTETLTLPDIPSGAALPNDQLQFDELSGQIERLLNALSPAVRRVFLLSRFEGLKHAEIALELQISTKTVEAHLTKALALFRKVLKP
jgi:RNA polymerase sigma-70 factor (family 1)